MILYHSCGSKMQSCDSSGLEIILYFIFFSYDIKIILNICVIRGSCLQRQSKSYVHFCVICSAKKITSLL